MLELRVGGLLVLIAYLFSIDTTVLSWYKIDISHAFGYHDVTSNPRKTADLMLIYWGAGCLLLTAQRMLLPTVENRIIPLATLLMILSVILKQRRLLRVLRRVAIGGISAENRLGDILVSDTLVSMGTVLVDIGYSFSLTYYGVPISSSVDRYNHIGYKTLLLACIPQGIRAKQCIIDFKRTGDKQHLLNLFKYIVGNFPHAIRAQIVLLHSEIPEEAAVKSTLESVLRKSLYANAIYSILWDTIVDWKLSRLRHPGASLRFPKAWYYAAAAADIILRFSFLVAMPIEHVIFSLQALELVRRGMWVLFRVESEPLELTNEIELATSAAHHTE